MFALELYQDGLHPYVEKRITVIPTPAGRKPSWGGYIPQFLGHRQEIDIGLGWSLVH